MIDIGVIGCGYWGPNLIRNFRSLQECRVRNVCDSHKNRLAYIERLYPDVETTTDFNQIIKSNRIQAVAIATPVRSHHSIAVQALQAEKHTFIEKPMASSADQCRELIELAEKKSLTLMIGHTFIYTAPVRKIKEIIAAGEIGDILYISSRRLNLGLFQKDVNVAWDLAPHDVSIILYIMGQAPISVNCQGKAHITPEIEDVTNMTLNFPNGTVAIIHNSWIDPRKVREITIVGSKKMIVYDDTEPLEKIKVYDKRVETPPHYDTFAEFHYSYHYGDMYAPYLNQVEPLKVECQYFLDCIESGEKSDSCGREGLKVVKILEAASESLRNGGSQIKL